ncbi:MAG: DNA-directed RNA polymerase subunit omega [Myxococcota bacterium]
MARVTVEDCLNNVDNRFALVLLSSQRARALLKGAKPTVEHSKNKAAVLSLREIAAGNVYYEGDLADVLADNAAVSWSNIRNSNVEK